MELRNISKSYHGRPVLQSVSFTIEPGVTALWAPSGAGKTTLLRILLGLERPDSGELLGTGVRWSAVFQEDRLLDGLDAMGNLRFALGSGWDEAAARRLLAELGLSDAEDRPVREWSGGMKRRLALARALLADAEAIALDEPFAGVDPIAVEDIQQIVWKLKDRNIGILITDHNVQETLSITDRAYLLFEGKILFQGTPEELAENKIVREKYLSNSFVLRRKDFMG